ncbi:hypothetical protein [uncultured Dokdonia sp.]|uniref:hypothetical protein n=1 Tax=uncultured Dokdonia sp. TaxID=575653 RepID=UPI00261EC500|nr:hypothetical protein [uncultured Dokdonia sp.]
MSIELIISLLGVFTAIIVAVVGAYMARNNNIKLELRKLKESHYLGYIQALNTYGNLQSEDAFKELLSLRNNMLLIANEKVINAMITYEKKGTGHPLETHNLYFTTLLKTMRSDLGLNNNDFPVIGLKRLSKFEVQTDEEQTVLIETNDVIKPSKGIPQGED